MRDNEEKLRVLAGKRVAVGRKMSVRVCGCRPAFPHQLATRSGYSEASYAYDATLALAYSIDILQQCIWGYLLPLPQLGLTFNPHSDNTIGTTLRDNSAKMTSLTPFPTQVGRPDDPSFAALPEEIIVKILECCDLKGVLASQLVRRWASCRHRD